MKHISMIQAKFLYNYTPTATDSTTTSIGTSTEYADLLIWKLDIPQYDEVSADKSPVCTTSQSLLYSQSHTSYLY